MRRARMEASFEMSGTLDRGAPEGLIEQLPLPVAVFDAEHRLLALADYDRVGRLLRPAKVLTTGYDRV